MAPKRCEVCGRKPGTLLNRDLYTKAPPRLGPLTQCDLCGLWACPDCLHEVDCCFRDADAHDKDRAWAPPGWAVESDDGVMITFQREAR